MILTNQIVNKLFNSEYLKGLYPMIDKIKTQVLSDEDDPFPFYVFHVVVHLNDPKINNKNMYEKGLDPHHMIQNDLKQLLKMTGINTRDIIQITITIIGANGEVIYG